MKPQSDAKASLPLHPVDQLKKSLTAVDVAPEEFLRSLIASQCMIADLQAGAVLRADPQGGVQLLAVFPAIIDGKTPDWLSETVGLFPKFSAQKDERVSVFPVVLPDGQESGKSIIAMPMEISGVGVMHAVFPAAAMDESRLNAMLRRLELSSALVGLLELRAVIGSRQAEMKGISQSIGIISSFNTHQKFAAAAMAFCNELAAAWRCERVSVGFLQGRYIKVKAVSHCDKVSPNSRLIGDIEGAMEECLDQDMEVFFPSGDDASFINRSAGELSNRHGPMTILSLPLRSGGQVIGVVLLERLPEQKFTGQEVQSLRLVCDLAAPRLSELEHGARWIGARLAHKSRLLLAQIGKSKYTWTKIIAATIFVLLCVMLFFKGQYDVHSGFTIQPSHKRIVPAAFDGYIESVNVDLGQDVTTGTELGRLSTSDLRQELLAAIAQREQYVTESNVAASQGNTAETQIADARAKAADAKVKLYEHQISKAKMIAPADGCVVTMFGGDLKRNINAPVKTGQMLFEVAPLNDMHAEIMVPEDKIMDIANGMNGELAVASHPDEKMSFVVERIEPAAVVEKGKNIFRVRARITGGTSWLRPGMEGEAAINAGRRSYGWLWLHEVINWVRMQLWL